MSYWDLGRFFLIKKKKPRAWSSKSSLLTFFQNHLNFVALSVKSFVDINRKIKPWEKKNKKNRELKQILLCCVGGGDEKYTGPPMDASCNGGSLSLHKIKLLIIPFPPKEGTEHGENETYYWSVSTGRKFGKGYPKHSKASWEGDAPITWDLGTGYTYHTRKLNGFCDCLLDEFIKHSRLSSLKVVGWA